jgi:SOS response regulatory protein OraA/RecX
MKVIYLRASRSKGYLSVGLSEGEERIRLVIPERELKALGSPAAGDEIDADVLCAMRLEDERYRARRFALNSLSLTDSTKYALKQKLRARGISCAVADEVVREMVSRGYINEERRLEHLCTELANTSLYGARGITARLLRKGFARGDIARMLAHLTDAGTIDFSENRRRLIDKLGDGADDESIKKLLYKQGF